MDEPIMQNQPRVNQLGLRDEQLTIEFNGVHRKRVGVKGRELTVKMGRSTRQIHIHDTYLMKTKSEGISVFNLKKVMKGEFVGIYTGELIRQMNRLDRIRLGSGEGTHFLV